MNWNWNVFFYRLAWVLLFGVPIFFVGKLSYRSWEYEPPPPFIPPKSEPVPKPPRVLTPTPHDVDVDEKFEERNRRYDKCVAAHGIPTAGFDAPGRWGLICLRQASIIYIDDTAW